MVDDDVAEPTEDKPRRPGAPAGGSLLVAAAGGGDAEAAVEGGMEEAEFGGEVDAAPALFPPLFFTMGVAVRW